MAKIIELIQTTTSRGMGIDTDPCRIVEQLYTKDGFLVAERDPFENQSFFLELPKQ